MIIEVYLLDDKDKKSVVTTLSPETSEEEDIIRNAKILHKNNLLVWWGDTHELQSHGKFVCYNGLKLCYDLPTEFNNAIECVRDEKNTLSNGVSPVTINYEDKTIDLVFQVPEGKRYAIEYQPNYDRFIFYLRGGYTTTFTTDFLKELILVKEEKEA